MNVALPRKFSNPADAQAGAALLSKFISYSAARHARGSEASNYIQGNRTGVQPVIYFSQPVVRTFEALGIRMTLQNNHYCFPKFQVRVMNMHGFISGL